MSFRDRLMNGYNAFMNKDPIFRNDIGSSYSYRPDRIRLSKGNERSIITSVYNRISLDCSAIDVKHVRLDEEDRYVETIDSGLNNCLQLEANIDQTGRALIQDIVMSMFNEGVVAVVPVDTDINPDTGSYDILTLRTAKIIEWYPRHVKVKMYNDRTGRHEELVFPKYRTAIIENPMFAVMNEPNSTAQRLIRKLALLDVVDEQNGSGKLDLIIQLPYQLKTEARRIQAKNRRDDIMKQLTESQLGIAYTDATEKVTQLNRPIENQLMTQIESLTRMLYSQLGLTEEIMNGTADEKIMTNYYNRTIEPIMSSIVGELKRKFLTKTGRTQGQSVLFFRDPFKLVPTTQLAELADKFTRNEIMSSNEIRQIVGMKPSDDPRADQLVNSNISQSNEDPRLGGTSNADLEEGSEEDLVQPNYDDSNEQLDQIDMDLDQLEELLSHSDVDNSDLNYLIHYSSPYYDPAKAHEYYEKYTKNGILKGRKESTEYTTSRLNDQGKQVYRIIKENLKSEKQSKLDANKKSKGSSGSSSNKSGTDKQISDAKSKMQNEINNHVTQTASKVSQLQSQIKKMQKSGKDKGRIAYIQNEISKLRKSNAEKRAQLNSEYQNTAASIRKANQASTSSANSQISSLAKQIRDEYSQKQKDELKKLIDSGEYKRVSKKKKSSTTSK